MNKIKNIFLLTLLTAALLLPQAGECYVTLSYKEVPAGYHTMKLPRDAYIIDYKLGSWQMPLLNDQELGKVVGQSPVNFYQIVLDDGADYRSAWLLCFTSEEKIPEKEKFYFNDLQQEQKDELLLMQALLREKIIKTIEENASLKADFSAIRHADLQDPNYFYTQMEVLTFDWPDLAFPIVEDRQTIESSVRAAGNFAGIFASLYAKGYAMEFDGHLQGIVFLCFDSEKAFWENIMDRAVKTVRK